MSRSFNSDTRSWLARDAAVVWHPFTQMATADPHLNIVRGEGALLFTEEGEAIIDAVSSWWVNVHGHAHPHIAKKVSEQLKTLEHTIFAGFTHPGAIALAERLLERLPENQKRIFYSDNGSTSVEVGLKMALQYWYNKGEERNKIIALRDAYHGDTFGAMSVSGRGGFNQPFEKLMFDVEVVDVPLKGQEDETLAQLQTILEKGNVASFIMEPLVQGSAGMVMYAPEILDRMIDKCREFDVLVHADEVMTGFGRTGTFFATDQLRNHPDIFSLSKGLTGGTMALGVTSCTQTIFDAFLSEDKMKTFFHGHSFTGNPVACAAACASLDIFDRKETKANIQRICDRHKQFGIQMKNHPGIAEIRQTGTILAVEVKTAQNTSYFNHLRDEMYRYFLNKGILLRPLGNVVYILAPYCITDEQLNRIYDQIGAFLDAHCIRHSLHD